MCRAGIELGVPRLDLEAPSHLSSSEKKKEIHNYTKNFKIMANFPTLHVQSEYHNKLLHKCFKTRVDVVDFEFTI